MATTAEHCYRNSAEIPTLASKPRETKRASKAVLAHDGAQRNYAAARIWSRWCFRPKYSGWEEPCTPIKDSLAKNRRARRDYHILETVEAGLSLLGSEVKSIRDGRLIASLVSNAQTYRPKDEDRPGRFEARSGGFVFIPDAKKELDLYDMGRHVAFETMDSLTRAW